MWYVIQSCSFYFYLLRLLKTMCPFKYNGYTHCFWPSHFFVLQHGYLHRDGHVKESKANSMTPSITLLPVSSHVEVQKLVWTCTTVYGETETTRTFITMWPTARVGCRQTGDMQKVKNTVERKKSRGSLYCTSLYCPLAWKTCYVLLLEVD